MSTENWLPVVGWEGIYEVSDQGQVRRVGSSKPRVATPNHRGYLQIVLSHGARRAAIRVHTTVLEAFVGPRPTGMQACHGNGLNADNRLVNLRWDTPESNVADRIRHGTQYRPSSKPTCQRGHELTGANVHLRQRNGYTMRTCRACTNERDRARRRAAKAAALAAAGLVLLALPATATQGPSHKELICHPVNGAGQTGTGWTLVDVDKARSHFDKSGNPKHRSHDMRTDVYATSGVCPSTPSPTTTGGTPSTPTAPSSSTTTTRPSATSTHLSPSQTSSTPTSATATTSQAAAPSTTTSTSAPTSKSPTRTGASASPLKHAPTSATTSPASPRRSGPSSTVAPPELAHTGAELVAGFLVGLGILLVGALFHAARILGRKGTHR